jgi:hypothetical protein
VHSLVVIAALLTFQQPADTAPRRAEVRRRPVTPALLASAFRDSAARGLLTLARRARVQTDSALRSYTARTWQRATMGLRIGERGPERMFYRLEQAGRVQWTRNRPAIIEVLGKRDASPSAPGLVSGNTAPSLPWFPGKEQLWIGTGGLVQAEVDERRTINPLAEGSEAYYTYASGDSTVLTLPPNERLVLRELRATPREPGWNVAIGSYWFDARSGQLVRAVYRLSIPVNLSDRAQASMRSGQSSMPRVFRMMAFPVTGRLTGVTVEYGRYAERFWLPRAQTAEGEIVANFATLPLIYEERFRYDEVLSTASTDAPQAIAGVGARDTAVVDSLLLPPRWDTLRDLPPAQRREIVQAWRSRVSAARDAQCATGTSWQVPTRRFNGAVEGTQLTPCDTASLSKDDAFGGPLFPADEQPFARSATAEADRLLGLGAQAGFAPRRIEWLSPAERGLMRFNRVEGLSIGIGARQELGGGFDWSATLRAGVADQWPNATLQLTRRSASARLSLEAYRQLRSTNAWGRPFEFGESLLALTAGRDDGFYARASGVRATWVTSTHWQRRTEVFAERIASASTASRRDRLFGWDPARLGVNPGTTDGWYSGVRVDQSREWGGDPAGTRVFVDLRTEAAAGTVAYGRASGTTSVRRGLGRWDVAATVSAGEALRANAADGTARVPTHLWWRLGGARTLRGALAGEQAGEAYHLLQLELGRKSGALRPFVGAEWGWAGRGRDRWTGAATPSASLGISAIDGLLRIELGQVLRGGRAPRLQVAIDANF